jgi:peptide deformylase
VHIGAVAPVAVISLADDEAKRDYLVLYNPEILALSGEVREGREGSVSMSGLQVPVSRPSRARIAYDDETGARHELELEGLPARIAQHEIDQVNGIFFLERISRLKRDMAIKRWKRGSRRVDGRLQ